MDHKLESRMNLNCETAGERSTATTVAKGSAMVSSLLLCLGVMAACGGGSSESGSTGGPSGTQNGPATGTRAGDDLFPYGGFGGGQEKILFVSSDKKKYIRQLDLRTGVPSDLFDALPEASIYEGYIVEGPTKSTDGRIAVLAMPKRSVNSGFGVVTDSAGKQLSRFKVGFSNPYSAGHISADGSQFAVYGQYVEPNPDPAKFIRRIGLKFYSVQSGEEKIVKIYSTDPNKSDPSLMIAWTPDNVLLVVSHDTLERFDINGTLLSTQSIPQLASPSCGTVSPDGKTLWFNQQAGNPYGRAVWSMDLGTLQSRRRVFDALSYGVRCPALSVDGKYLSLIHGEAASDGINVGEFWNVGAATVQDAEVETTGKLKLVADANRVAQRAGGVRSLMQ